MAKLLKNFTLRLLALSINLQLVVSPIAYAEGDGLEDKSKQESKEKSGGSNKFWTDASKITETAMGALGQTMQILNGQSNPMQNLLISPATPAQMPPALQQSGCLVFVARTDSPGVGMCEPSLITPEKAAESKALLATANSNVETLESYLVNANERDTSQGKACLNKSAKQMQTMLKARLEHLNMLEKQVEDLVKNTKQQTEIELNALRKGDALLNGKSKDAENNSLADFDFGKQFKSPTCASFIQESKIAEVGDKGGYRAIEEMLNKNFESSNGKNDAYSPKELFGNESLIRKDIDDLLANFNENINNIDSVDLKPEQIIDGAQTSVFPSANKSVSNVLKNELKQYQRKMNDKRRQLRALPKETLALIESGAETSADAAATFKRQQYNKCLDRFVGNGKSFAKSITNFTLSKNADRNRDSLLRTTVYENLMDSDIGIDQKIQNISQIDNNANEKIRMSSSQTLCGRKIYADTRVSVSKLMSLYKCECEQRYNAKPAGQSLSSKQLESQLAGYSSYIKNSKKALSQEIAKNVKDKVLSCPADQSTGVGSLSCDKALNKSSNNFCLRTAKMCAGNMKACFDEANQILVATRTQQKNTALSYNAKINDMKLKMEIAFKANEKKVEQYSRNLDAMFKVGSVYNVPLNLQMDQLKNKLLKGMDPSLKVEDPDEYLKIAKADIQKTRESLKKSSNEIFGADVEKWNGLVSKNSSTSGFLGVIAQQLDNAEKERKRWSAIQDKCVSSILAMNKQIDAANKQNAEKAQKNQEFLSKQVAHCRELKALSKSGCANIGVGSLALDVLQATSATTGSDNSSAVRNLCNNYDDKIAKIEESTDEKKLKLLKVSCNENCSYSKLLSEVEQCIDSKILEFAQKDSVIKDIKVIRGGTGKYVISDDPSSKTISSLTGATFQDLSKGLIDRIKASPSCKKMSDLESNQAVKDVYVSEANKNYKRTGQEALSNSQQQCDSLLAGSRDGGDKTGSAYDIIQRTIGSAGSIIQQK